MKTEPKYFSFTAVFVGCGEVTIYAESWSNALNVAMNLGTGDRLVSLTFKKPDVEYPPFL